MMCAPNTMGGYPVGCYLLSRLAGKSLNAVCDRGVHWVMSVLCADPGSDLWCKSGSPSPGGGGCPSTPRTSGRTTNCAVSVNNDNRKDNRRAPSTRVSTAGAIYLYAFANTTALDLALAVPRTLPLVLAVGAAAAAFAPPSRHRDLAVMVKDGSSDDKNQHEHD